MTFKLGLTGSIGMGKSTTAGFFVAAAIPVWDADAAVHEIYQGIGVTPISKLVPQAIIDGIVDRSVLKQAISKDAGLLTKIEVVIHPLVREHRTAFLVKHLNSDIAVLDIPLLFETNRQNRFDAVLVVTAPPEIQKSRVLARDGMTESHFMSILARQMPDSEKREKADYVIDTSNGIDAARTAVNTLIEKIRSEM
ncbi:MAG: dephospho-CoA kinase [Rhodobacteraceae bacterium]|nr:dephospho-CoA kinase [Paracoccaceae bacterium]